MNNSTEHATSSLMVLEGLEGNEAPHLSGVQPFLDKHIEVLQLVWWSIFLAVLATAVFKAYREISSSKSK